MRVLVIEDEIHLAEALVQILKKNNFTADAVFDGENGFDYAQSQIYDLIVLDIMLPKMDGISILRELRSKGCYAPVMLLTAKGDTSDKVKGLDSGADDYLAKPFATDEFMARVRALTRRRGEIVFEDALKYADIALDMSKLLLIKDVREIKLTLKEAELLELLIIRKSSVSSKELILERLWGFDSQAEHNHVEVYVSFLRKKLGYLESNANINTVRGVGYILGVAADVQKA